MAQNVKAPESLGLSQEDIQKIKKSIMQHVAVDDESQITQTSSLTDDFDIDSLDFIVLIMDLEREFNININQEQLKKIKTVRDIYEAVSEGLTEK